MQGTYLAGQSEEVAGNMSSAASCQSMVSGSMEAAPGEASNWAGRVRLVFGLLQAFEEL